MRGLASRAARSAPATDPIAIVEARSPYWPGALVKDADGHRRDEDRKVQSERADEEKHEKERLQIRSLPDVAEALGEAPARPESSIPQMKLADADDAQRAEHRDERGRVDEEDPPGTDGGDENAGNGRSDHPRGVERRRVQRHGVGHVGLGHQVRHERLPRRRVERRDASEKKREHVDVPQLDRARRR